MAVVPAARHHHRPHKPPPFGLQVPRSPAWPPYQTVKLPGQPTQSGRWTWFHIFNGVINIITSFLPADESDIRSLSDAVGKKMSQLGNILEEDIHAAYTSNLDYSHAILQFTEDVGRAAQAELARLSADLKALDHRERRHFHTLGQETKNNKKYLIRQIHLARAYAIKKAVADSRAYVVKDWSRRINYAYHFAKHADHWWTKRIGHWWHKAYKDDIRPIYGNQKATFTSIRLIWLTINGEIKPTVKLVAKAGDWLKFFAHWKRKALLAFGVLKASEVAAWLEEKYVAGPK